MQRTQESRLRKDAADAGDATAKTQGKVMSILALRPLPALRWMETRLKRQQQIFFCFDEAIVTQV